MTGCVFVVCDVNTSGALLDCSCVLSEFVKNFSLDGEIFIAAGEVDVACPSGCSILASGREPSLFVSTVVNVCIFSSTHLKSQSFVQ
jgi:hypothetical protein